MNKQRMAALAAIALGVGYTLSPLSVVVVVWMALLFRWAASGTRGRERQWLLATLWTALSVRMLAVALLPFLVDPSQHAFTSYFGDAVYAVQRSIWIRNAYLGVPMAARDYIEAFEPVFGWSAYNYMLAYLHLLFGPSPYGVAVVSTGLFLTAAVLIYRCARTGFGSAAALGGLAVMLFMPTWLAWSVAPLKEPMQVLTLAVALTASIALIRGRWPGRLAAVGALTLAVAVSASLRNGGAALIVAGVFFGLGLFVISRRWWITAAAIVVLPIAAITAARSGTVRQRVAATVMDAAMRHVGFTRTDSAVYRLLDERFYLRDINDKDPEMITVSEGARYLAKAPLAFISVPLPWAPYSAKWIVFTPQQVLWYALVVLAVFGVGAGARRDPLLTCLLVGLIAGPVAIIAPNSGNIGTAIRHRDMIVPFVIALAGMGACSIANRVAEAAEAQRSLPALAEGRA